MWTGESDLKTLCVDAISFFENGEKKWRLKTDTCGRGLNSLCPIFHPHPPVPTNFKWLMVYQIRTVASSERAKKKKKRRKQEISLHRPRPSCLGPFNEIYIYIFIGRIFQIQCVSHQLNRKNVQFVPIGVWPKSKVVVDRREKRAGGLSASFEPSQRGGSSHF